MSKKTAGWIVYKIEDGRPRFLGIFHSKKCAQEEIACLNDLDTGEWFMSGVMFIGWGIDENGMFGANEHDAPTGKQYAHDGSRLN
jgi:hypothetical protein